MRRRIRRCSGENSAAGAVASRVTSRVVRLAEGFSDGDSTSLDIAFSPPGKDEGTAPPLFRFLVEPHRNGNELAMRGNEGERTREPDRKQRTPGLPSPQSARSKNGACTESISEGESPRCG